MVALSILPPPPSHEPAGPFGFGAFVVTQRDPGEAAFELHAHGFGAGYSPHAMREMIRDLFTPETMALIYERAEDELDRVISDKKGREGELMLEFVSRSGLRTRVHAAIPYHLLLHAGRIGGVQLPSSDFSPLGRIGGVGAEAQSIWIHWLILHCSRELSRSLFASFMAWREVRRAQKRSMMR
jgi:hypothetical protein